MAQLYKLWPCNYKVPGSTLKSTSVMQEVVLCVFTSKYGSKIFLIFLSKNSLFSEMLHQVKHISSVLLEQFYLSKYIKYKNK